MQDRKPQELSFKEVLADMQAVCLTPVDVTKLRTSLKLTVAWLASHGSGLDSLQLAQVWKMQLAVRLQSSCCHILKEECWILQFTAIHLHSKLARVAPAVDVKNPCSNCYVLLTQQAWSSHRSQAVQAGLLFPAIQGWVCMSAGKCSRCSLTPCNAPIIACSPGITGRNLQLKACSKHPDWRSSSDSVE